MPNLFKSLISRGDDDEELDLEFDLANPENDCFELPPDRRDNQVLARARMKRSRKYPNRSKDGCSKTVCRRASWTCL